MKEVWEVIRGVWRGVYVYDRWVVAISACKRYNLAGVREMMMMVMGGW